MVGLLTDRESCPKAQPEGLTSNSAIAIVRRPDESWQFCEGGNISHDRIKSCSAILLFCSSACDTTIRQTSRCKVNSGGY